MSTEEVDRLRALLETHGLAELEYHDRDRHLVVSRAAPATRLAKSTILPAPTITAPCAGIFRGAHPLAAQIPSVPRSVRSGEIVAYLQSGMLLRPVLAPLDGLIGTALVADDDLTGFRTPLFAYLE